MHHVTQHLAMQPLVATLLALAATTTPPPAAAQVQALGPVVARPLMPWESATVDGLAPVPQADLNLRASAAVSVWANGRGSAKQAVQRSNLGIDAAVHASAPQRNAPLLPALIGNHLHAFDGGDSAQAWATMTAQGVPHLFVQGYGDFRAEATAAWTSRYTLGGSTSREVVLRFMVPPTTVTGDWEQNGPAKWRSQMRADVLVNGFPVWSTTALRTSTEEPAPDDLSAQPVLVLQQFGDPLVFPTNDEDTPPGQGGLANDSAAGYIEGAAQARIVSLSLGRFNPGQQIELNMILRGMAFTEPRVSQSAEDKRDNRCRDRPEVGKFFCSRATATVRMGNMAPQLTLLP